MKVWMAALLAVAIMAAAGMAAGEYVRHELQHAITAPVRA